jgi:hypothetical protein
MAVQPSAVQNLIGRLDVASISGSVPEIHLASLASHRHCVERIQNRWPGFLAKREQRMEQHRRLDGASEKVAENILEDLFTDVLDWPLSDFNNQVEYADIVLTSLGVRWLIVEAKHLDALAWNRRAVESALEQALRYASEQRVKIVAVSDGRMLYAANVVDGGLRDRAYVDLDKDDPPLDLWWLSVQGIWRERDDVSTALLRLLPEEPADVAAMPQTDGCVDQLLHPKYHIPARCFAYVGDFGRPSTWKLPYLLADGTIDAKRLPKAVQCILTNYRGAKVGGIPEEAIPAVLERLAKAARHAGHMPPVACHPAPIYWQLSEALEQFEGRNGVG